LHDAGIQVIGIIPNLRLAKRVEAAGIDMIVLEGTEAGGRIGRIATMAQLTNVLPEVKLPVIAAGGIVDGRGMAAALIMGAEGIQMGTRFLVSEECIVHPQYKEEIIKATDEDSVETGLSRNLGMRGLRSPFTEKYHQMEISGVPIDELNKFATGASRRVAENGLGDDGMNGMVQCGQGVVPIKEIKSVKQIIEETVEEAERLLRNAPSLVR
jgi:enoyl-[acyl-carrier protein] reductase II